ncbi:helix-turn-helix transcriptional regulator [Paenibacillus montanisoli]|uniref:HTH araC/xylS-type domain-containing protein n=1 Tax=Paenibacillus montanisoli TaxID=2081970 RepID=A0A328TWP8_9BACL|nr:helix-turn-helix domain-containing protein [Paenibacillus montanisoli]RAP74102.1 hypothetical protein DL346_23815 [Paenibacillus montanisoli]
MVPICPFVRFAIRVPLRPGERHGPRYCYVPSLYLVESGSATVLFEDGKAVRLQTGALFFLQPGIAHTWVIEGPDPFAFRCVFFEWSYRPKPTLRVTLDLLSQTRAENEEDLLDEPFECGLPERLAVDSVPYWKGLFEAADTNYQVLHAGDYPRTLAVNGHFHILLHQVYQLAERQNDPMDPRIAKLLAAMEQHAGGAYRDVDGWAESLGLSRSHFHALFRAQTGMTPKRYWNQCRIRKAQTDLLGTNDSVTEIAERYGYSSLHVFTKSFHQWMGAAPTDYRRMGRLL